jgi:hypothetical protein
MASGLILPPAHCERNNLNLRMGIAALTPAMVAGVTDHVWSLEEMISLLN